MERKEMQPILSVAVATVLTEHEVPKDTAHLRRMIRCLIRMAARICINAGAPLGAFVQLALSCYLDETKEGAAEAIDLSLKIPEAGAGDVN